MTAKHITMKFVRYIIPVILLGRLAVSCTNEDTDTDKTVDSVDKAANGWVYEIMRESYLWRDQLPSSPNYDRDYYTFFKSLLSIDDGKHDAYVDDYYSSIIKYVGKKDSLENQTRAEFEYLTSSYGFDYIITKSFLYDSLVSVDNRYEKLYATIVNVTENSPANDPNSTKEQLRRGMHIYKIDGKEIPRRGYKELLSKLHAPITGSSTVNFTTCELTQVTDENKELVFVDYTDDYGRKFQVPLVTRNPVDKHKPYTLTSDFIYKNPIQAITITADGKKVGYLIYNEFDSGARKAGEDGLYDATLRNVFGGFKEDQIDALIIDLRYNPGGLVSSCQLLASLIAGPEFKGQIFCNMVDSNGDKKAISYMDESNGLGMSEVYIIASGYSASASEMLIHGLRGSGIEVHHIGSPTEGKNVGQEPKSSDELINEGSQLATALGGYSFLIYPVTFRVEDANGTTYPTTGIDPEGHDGYLFYEEFVVNLEPRQSPEEPMLAAALYHIKNGAWPPAAARKGTRGQSALSATGDGVPRHFKPARPIIYTGN